MFKKYLEKIVEYGFYLFVFLLPWQTRWLWHEGILNGGYWEYGSFSLYATDIILLAILFLSLSIRHGKSFVLKSLWVPVIGFWLVCFASIFWSQNKEVSWYAFIKLTEAIWLFSLILRIKISWQAIGVAMISSGLAQAVLGIYQFFSQEVFSNKWLGLASHQPGVLGDFVIETVSGRWLKAYGAFPHPNMLAGFLVVCLLVAAGFLLPRSAEKRGKLWLNILNIVALVTMAFGLVLTFSRSAWLVLTLVFLLLFAISLWQKNKQRLKITAAIIITMILTAFVSVLIIPEVWQTRLTGGRLETMSGSERVEQYKQSWAMIKDYWYQGTGAGTYTHVLNKLEPALESWQYQPVHNIFLLITTEIGIVGGLIFVLIIFRFFQKFICQFKFQQKDNHWWLAYSMSFLALLIIGIFDHYLWSLSFGLLFFWLILGLWAKQYLESRAQ